MVSPTAPTRRTALETSAAAVLGADAASATTPRAGHDDLEQNHPRPDRPPRRGTVGAGRPTPRSARTSRYWRRRGTKTTAADVHIDLTPGDHAWVAEVPDPASKDPLQEFIIPYSHE